MGYYPSGKEEFDEEAGRLRLEREEYYICKKCGEAHSKTKCPKCSSTSKRNNNYDNNMHR